jgi:hypothetical protein
VTESSDIGASPGKTNLLLASNKVDGTKLLSRDGDSLGSVHSFMFNKATGAAVYAVLSLGGFLGIGKSFYPLPFDLLSYDHAADSYVVQIDRRQLEGVGPTTRRTLTKPMPIGSPITTALRLPILMSARRGQAIANSC